MKSRLFALLLCSALFACGKNEASHEATKAEPSKTPDDMFVGQIEGVVRLENGATLPKLPDINNGSKLVIVAPPAPCSSVRDEDLMPIRLGAGGVLTGMHIALTDMTKVPETKPTTRELTLTDCRLTPSVIGAIRGDSLRVTNRSEAALLPTLSGESFMQAILPGESRTLKLEKTGPLQLSCGFGVFCGRTDVLVTTHSLFAVSDANGHFTVNKVPLDQDVSVHAWHPLFRVATVRVRLSAKEPRKTIELVVSPQQGKTAPASDSSPANEKSKGESLKPL